MAAAEESPLHLEEQWLEHRKDPAKFPAPLMHHVRVSVRQGRKVVYVDGVRLSAVRSAVLNTGTPADIARLTVEFVAHEVDVDADGPAVTYRQGDQRSEPTA